MNNGKLRKDSQIVMERVGWWLRIGIDSVAHLTFDESRGRSPGSNRAMNAVVRGFLEDSDVLGHVFGVVEPHADGRLHCHIAYERGRTDYRTLREAWTVKRGRCDFHAATEHSCRACDRSNCRDRRIGGGCHDLEYIARKMTHDGRCGDRYVEFTLSDLT